jgi:tight adherence protein B
MVASTLLFYLAIVVAIYGVMQGCLYFAADLREEVQKESGKIRRHRLADGLSPWLRDILLSGAVRRFDNIVQTSGLNVRTERVLLGMMLATIILIIVVDYGLAPMPLLSFAAGFGLGGVLPYFFFVFLRDRRMVKLTAQLPETLDMIIRSLRAGHPIQTAIGMVSKAMPDPIGGEFKRVADWMAFGSSLREALEKMTYRLNTVPELKFVVAAIRIQAISGGNLAEILDTLSKLMRDQTKLKMKIRAIAAEGRVSGYILAGLPIVMFGVFNVLNPHYYADAMGNPLLIALGGAACLILGGIAMIRRILNIRV